MAVERIIGVDFGTSTSVIRVKRYENGKAIGENLETKEVIFGGIGSSVPTLIRKKADDESIVYYGYEAQQKRKKTTTYHSFKVDLESHDHDTRTQARALTEEFFYYLANVYKDQSNGGHLGNPDDKERTIVSYPVKWSEETRKFMIEAAKNAGFPNVTGMDEAQAAIHAVTIMSEDHLRKNNLLVNGKSSNILLIDMGAGTTDLVLCRHTPGAAPKTEILTTWPKSGEILFGGREVDSLLQGFFRDFMKPDDLERALKSVGVDQFKSWKEESVSPALAKNDAVTDFFALDNYADIVGIEMDEYSLDRVGFEKCLGDYLKQLPQLINGCLQSAGMNGGDVDLVIVTGGHSQWYFVKEMLTGKLPEFGEIALEQIQKDASRVIPITRPQETVALGLVYSPIQVVIAEKPVPMQSDIVSKEIVVHENADEQISEVKLLAPVKKDGKWGYIDQNGKLVIPCQWDSADSFSEGRAFVKKDGKYGIINKMGQVVGEYKWDFAKSFSEGFACVRKNSKWGFVDINGNNCIPCRWDSVGSFSEGMARVGIKNKYNNCDYGYINTHGELAIPHQWTYAGDFAEGLAVIGYRYGATWKGTGYINHKGEVQIKLQKVRFISDFSEGLAQINGFYKWGLLDDTYYDGFVNKSGNCVISCVWPYASNFHNGLACVRKNGKYGFINISGTLQIPLEWNNARDYSEEYALVKNDNACGFIDKHGKIMIPYRWEWYQFGDIVSFHNGYAGVTAGGKWGFIDKAGNEICSCIWDDVRSFGQ